LSVVNGNVSGSAVLVQIDSASPLATVGGAAMVRSSGGSFLLARTAQETFYRLDFDVHARSLHDYRL